MADLRRFQTQSQTQANLSPVPTAQPTTSPALALAGVATQLAPTVVGAVQAGRAAEQEAEQGKLLGGFTAKLAAAQQRGQIDPNFNSQQKQRELFQAAVAENPSLSGEYIKLFHDATGLKPAGTSEEEKAFIDFRNEAWAAGFGSPTATAEENEQQLELYRRLKNQGALMDFATKTTEFNKENTKQDMYKATASMAETKTLSIDITLNSLMNELANGGSRAEAELRWGNIKVQHANDMAQLGEFVNDPVIVAQMQGITTLFELGDKVLSGEMELNEARKASQIPVEKQKAIVAADPKSARLIAVSEMFANNPTLVTVSHGTMQALLSPGPSDLTEATGDEKSTIHQTLVNMADSGDENAIKEAAGHIQNVAAHLDRNGLDYTDENILEVCSVMEVPELYDTIPASGKNVIASACEVYVADVANKEIRNLEREGSISLQREQVTPRGDTRFVSEDIPLESYADTEVNSEGIRYIAKPEFRNNRQVQRKLQDINRQMERVNPVAKVYSAATGRSVPDVTMQLWGIGNVEEGTSATTPTTQTPAVEQLGSEQFRTQFIEAAVGSGATEEQANALWSQVNSPAVTVEEPAESTAVIGGQVFSEEEAEELLSVPAT